MRQIKLIKVSRKWGKVIYLYKGVNVILLLYLKFSQNFKIYHVSKLEKTYSMSYFSMFLCHILSFWSSGLNCEFIRRKYGFLINLKLSFMSSGDKPILTLKIDRNIRTGTIFNQREPSCKKKELHVNSTLNTFQGKYVNFG